MAAVIQWTVSQLVPNDERTGTPATGKAAGLPVRDTGPHLRIRQLRLPWLTDGLSGRSCARYRWHYLPGSCPPSLDRRHSWSRTLAARLITSRAWLANLYEERLDWSNVWRSFSIKKRS